jgi:hypothetical protein
MVMYGLKQVPRALYGMLRGYLFERDFEMVTVDQTLSLLRQGKEILIMQVYMDDIVFGGSSNSLIARFAKVKLIIRPLESSATSTSVRQGQGPEMLLTLFIRLLLQPLSRKT